LGKIYDALNKYAKQQKITPTPKLTKADLDVLLAYDRKNHHLVNRDAAAGQAKNRSYEALRNSGTLQRLLDNKLIFPGGKLTPTGLQECERLQILREESKSAEVSETSAKANRTVEVEYPDVFKKLDTQDRTVQATPAHEKPRLQVVKKEEPPQQKETPPEDSPYLNLPEIKETELLQSAPPKTLVDDRKKESKLKLDKRAAPPRVEPKTEAPKKREVQKTADDQPTVSVGEPGVLYDAKKRDKNLVVLLDPHSFEAEQFKMLRSRILFPISGTPPKSILVTSALPGEGKSFVAANLAISIAMEINKYVLLVDCDLRKPDLHHQFGFNHVSGLSDYLADQRELASLLLQTGIEKLTLLPGGAARSNPSELMSSNRMAELLDEVKYRYHDRLIVIDSPPLGLSAETSFLARQADGTLVVTRYGKTPKAKVADMLESVGTHKILGCILNQMDKRVARYYGYRKYGSRPYGQ